MDKNQMFAEIKAHAQAMGVTTDVNSMLNFSDPNEANQYTQISHVRGKSPVGNVIAMGVAWVKDGEAHYEKGTITADEVRNIDAGGQRGMLWV
jgi:hypothetical protein